jgi:hypothetical protein
MWRTVIHHRVVLVFAACAAACGGGKPQPAAPAASAVPPPLPAPSAMALVDRSAEPPPPGLAPDWKFPRIQDAPLDNGLVVRVIERHQLPVVQLDLVVKSGSATDREKPGLASVAGELLKAGGAG